MVWELPTTLIEGRQTFDQLSGKSANNLPFRRLLKKKFYLCWENLERKLLIHIAIKCNVVSIDTPLFKHFMGGRRGIIIEKYQNTTQ